MLVKCPVCQAEYQLEPGKYKCECGAKFWVMADGGVSLADSGTAAGNDRTSRIDPERTMAPKTTHDKSDNSSFDPDRTVANLRVRREHGDLQIGDVILGRYELLDKLGSGAMGVVFKCRDQVSRVEYALKMVPPELASDAEAMEEVRENFQLVHGLKHPNIASMDFLDRDEYGAYFLIMEYAKGESLAQWIRKKWKTGRPALQEVANIVKQIASALDYAHSQQILHRDIKPANVMIDEQGNVKVLDFGLASKVRSTMTALSVNQANSSGTPNYLSPEQFKGKYPGPASDQYALGVLTYQMLAGHLPFDSDDFNVLRAAVNSETPDRIDELPDTVNRCMLKVLNKNPKERFGNCAEFAETFTILTDVGLTIKKEPQGEPRKVSKTEPTPTVGIQPTKRMEQKKNPDVKSEKKTDIPLENQNVTYRYKGKEYSKKDIVEIAKSQKALLWETWIGLFCVFSLIAVGFTPLTILTRNIRDYFILLLGLTVICDAVFCLGGFFSVRIAKRRNILLSIVCEAAFIILLFYLNIHFGSLEIVILTILAILIVSIFESVSAIPILKSVGLKVGWLGVSKAELEKFNITI